MDVDCEVHHGPCTISKSSFGQFFLAKLPPSTPNFKEARIVSVSKNIIRQSVLSLLPVKAPFVAGSSLLAECTTLKHTTNRDLVSPLTRIFVAHRNFSLAGQSPANRSRACKPVSGAIPHRKGTVAEMGHAPLPRSYITVVLSLSSAA